MENLCPKVKGLQTFKFYVLCFYVLCVVVLRDIRKILTDIELHFLNFQVSVKD